MYQKSKNVNWEIINCFTNHEKQLLNYLMVLIQLHLRLKQSISWRMTSFRLSYTAQSINYKKMLQILPIALAQVKAHNTPENLLNKIRQIIYILYRAKEVTKNVYEI